MPIHFRCLLLDHDDTAVKSTEAVHYPAHLESLRVLRPGLARPTLEKWLLANFHGIMEYLVGELGLTPEELARELEIWRSFTSSRSPDFFPGFTDVLADFRRCGGRVAVISHSEADVIEAHYRRAGDPDCVPDLIFGWTADQEKRKPSPWPVREALSRFGLAREEALIVDDLKPGVLMSRASGVAIAGAGWSHRVAEIERYMRAHTIAYFESVEAFRDFLLC
jgi:beta-phosphoglucomutase-like phosphatase (HAD superfamily)